MNARDTSSGKDIQIVHHQVRRALEQAGVSPGSLLVVGVSGGPDSLALLNALYHLHRDLNLSLHGSHLNHGLRGNASKTDALFVAKIFKHLDIGFTLEEADVASFQEDHGLSLEEAARKVRYDFLSRVCLQQDADAVVVGHTADDQAETILMNIIRGAGLNGLRGMQTTTHRSFEDSNIVLLRPMLAISRAEVVRYCNTFDLKPRQDESNFSLEQTRNRVRMEVLPMLETYNPAVRKALIRLSQCSSQTLSYMDSEIDKIWHKTVHQGHLYVSVSLNAFRSLDQALQNQLLRRVVFTIMGKLEDIDQSHIDNMASLMAGPAGKSLDLPGTLRFSVSYEEAVLARSTIDLCPLPPLDGQHTLNVPGETLVPGWRITADTIKQEERTQSPPSTYTAYLNYNVVGDTLWLRTRRPGDRFQPLGMRQCKKLQDFMVDSKIPGPWRSRVPLVESPAGITWVVGWRIAEWAETRDNETLYLRLQLFRQ